MPHPLNSPKVLLLTLNCWSDLFLTKDEKQKLHLQGEAADGDNNSIADTDLMSYNPPTTIGEGGYQRYH